MTRTWTIGSNTFTWHDCYNNGTTTFPDGRTLTAAPNDDADTHAQAAKLGYGDTPEELARMCREHELLHTFLAVREGKPVSPTLHSVALMIEGAGEGSPGIPPIEERWYEEEQVMDVQKKLNIVRQDHPDKDHPYKAAQWFLANPATEKGYEQET